LYSGDTFIFDAGREDICELLIQKGVDLDAKGKDNDSALHIAARGAPARIVEMLLEGQGRSTPPSFSMK
jgi:ankyrin repeat protein